MKFNHCQFEHTGSVTINNEPQNNESHPDVIRATTLNLLFKRQHPKNALELYPIARCRVDGRVFGQAAANGGIESVHSALGIIGALALAALLQVNAVFGNALEDFGFGQRV